MSQLSRQFQGFKLQYPYANVSDFYGGLVIKDIQQQLNNLGIDVNGLNTTLTTLETIVNSLELSKVVGIKNIYTKNLLLNELKTYKNIKITPVLQGLNVNFGQRQTNTSYQSRMDIVINQQDNFSVNNNGVTNNLYRMWYPFLQKEYKLSSPTAPNWIQAQQNDNVIRLNNQRLLYFGDLTGEWTVNTEYFVGDLVYVQSSYPSFMGMPQGQTQTFVFICLQDHTSDSDTNYYQNFFRTDDDYIDNNGNHVFPIIDTTGDNNWQILRLDNGSCRQWWFWNNNTNSVTATLYTSEMFNLHYPISGVSNDTYFLFQGTQDDPNNGNSSYNNSAHTLRQNNGIIVSIDGVLTLWASNWWKSQTVTSNSAQTEDFFPVDPNDGLGVVEDGNEETGKFLWVKFSSVAMSYDSDQNYIQYPIITLPVNIDIQPHANLFVSRFSNVVNKTLKVINLVSDIIDADTFGNGSESTTGKETLTFIFDHNQGHWYNENT